MGPGSRSHCALPTNTFLTHHLYPAPFPPTPPVQDNSGAKNQSLRGERLSEQRGEGPSGDKGVIPAEGTWCWAERNEALETVRSVQTRLQLLGRYRVDLSEYPES